MEIFWSILPDKAINEYGFVAALAVAGRAGNLGYSYITSNCQRTDVARNKLCAAFRKLAADPNDVLVMLDCDHTHSHDIIERLVAHSPDHGVVGALAFRRGEPFYACYFMRDVEGKLAIPLDIPGVVMHGELAKPDEHGELVPCTIVGTGAIAVRRWVLDKIAEAGYPAPFLYEYSPDMFETGEFQSEDITFGLTCEKLGIAHYCDTSLITPHLITSAVDQTAWAQYAALYKGQPAPVIKE